MSIPRQRHGANPRGWQRDNDPVGAPPGLGGHRDLPGSSPGRQLGPGIAFWHFGTPKTRRARGCAGRGQSWATPRVTVFYPG